MAQTLDILSLVLTMIEANNKFVPNLFSNLNFTKKDIENFIQKYNVLKDPRCNELGFFILLKNNYITNEEFAKYMNLDYKDGSFWIVADSFDDILSKKYEFEIKILDGDYLDYNYDFYKLDVSDYFYYYDEDTLKAIIDYCIKNNLEFDDEVITEENITIKDGKIYVNDIKLEDVIDDDRGLSDLRDELNWAICEAQHAADFDEMYSKIINGFKTDIGDFERKIVKNYKGEDVEKIYIKLENKTLDNVEKFLREEYKEYEYTDETYGNVFYVLREMEYFDFDTPDYNYIYGDIDKSVINDYTQSRLYG